MPTQKIKVEIEAEVPVGELCKGCCKLDKDDMCIIWPSEERFWVCDKDSFDKCDSCQDACEGGKGS